LLADFYDVDGLADQALRALREPGQFRHLGTAARLRIEERYELTHCMARRIELFQSLLQKSETENGLNG
jgi:hypothetical protein